VLYDHAVDQSVRLGRARALERLGAVFAANATAHDETWQDSLARTVGEAIATSGGGDAAPGPAGAPP